MLHPMAKSVATNAHTGLSSRQREGEEAGDERKEQEKERKPQVEDVLAHESEDGCVEECQEAGIEIGEIPIRKLAGENPFGAVGERSVVVMPPALIEPRHGDDGRARD